jgi:dihydrolipoamide dehydrogenase
MQVTLVDPAENPGGVCLYRGCIPSKALLHVAKLLDEAKARRGLGRGLRGATIDLNRLRGFKEKVVNQLTGGLGQLSNQRRSPTCAAPLRSATPHSLEVADAGGKTTPISFDYAIVATGSRPATVPGLSIQSPRLMDSTGALELPDIPQSLLVVGGGYIGLELGSVYAALGTKVTVVEMTGGLLPGADRDLVNVLAKRIEKICEAVLLNTKVGCDEGSRRGASRSTFEGEGSVSGRRSRPSTACWSRSAAGRTAPCPASIAPASKVNQRGFIEVDEKLQTAEPSIYAIGDVVGEPMLAHKASHEGRLAVEAIAGEKVAFEPLAIPAVVFTDPELAWCGLTGSDAPETGPQGHGRAVPVGRVGPRADARSHRRHDQAGHRSATERDPRRRHRRTGAGELIAEGVLASRWARTRPT